MKHGQVGALSALEKASSLRDPRQGLRYYGEAAEAGAKALAPVIERELASLPFNFKAKSQRAGEGWVTIMDSPTSPAIAA